MSMMVADISVSVSDDTANTKDYIFESQITGSSNEAMQDIYKDNVLKSVDVALEMIKED